MSRLRFTCALAHGFHARPASLLAEALRPFAARVEIVKEASGKRADARSVLSVVSLDVAHGDACALHAEGDDAAEAVAALQALIESGFGEAALAAAQAVGLPASAAQPARLPAGLRRMGVPWIAGRGISPGFAFGPVAIVRPFGDAGEARADPAARSPHAERREAHRALREVRHDLQVRHDSASDDLQRDLLRAHAGIAEDPALRANIDQEIDRGASAAAAVRRAAKAFVAALRSSASAYIRDRAIDVEDVCQQALERLGESPSAVLDLQQPSVIVADLLTPRQVMSLDRSKVRALVLGRVGATSHTAILARAFGIPTVVDVHDAEGRLAEGGEVIVDAAGGFVLPEVTDEVRRYYRIAEQAVERRRARLAPFAAAPAKSRDGVRLEIAANVSTPEEVGPALRDGAEAIGLFRTEMLFLDRPAPPTEDEQHRAYASAIEQAAGRPIIIRTFDIGGDKPAPYLRLPHEENPFLGWRGVRLYQRFDDLLRSQLRAILRAAAHGPVKVMAPMIANAREAEWFVQRVRDTHREGNFAHPLPPLGVMIEVPAAALAIGQLAGIVDFFSIGTNDLAQYFMAVDRGNPRVAGLCDPLEPAFVRLLKVIVDDARRHNRWIGVCGEMAGEPLHLPLMLALGVDEISVASSRVLELKSGLAELDRTPCVELLERACAAREAGEVRQLLSSAPASSSSSSIIEPDLVIIGSAARSRAEAIRELASLLAAAGRADDEHAVEEAVWAREDTYSTGMGFGIAIPHCKTDAVRAPTIAVAQFAHGVDWGAADGEPARIAILLAIPAGADAGSAEPTQAARAHMQILAQLARKLMHEDFRESLMQARTPEAMVAAITRAVTATTA